MDNNEVRITDIALKDMEDIYNYIAFDLHAPESAINQYNRISNAILTLESSPEKFALFEMEPEHSWGMRRMVVDNYLVCYVVDPGIVTVTDVLYGASNVHARILDRYNQQN